ncbi:hypothetical protein ACTXJX_07965, partial [Glutamicibacter ardleyensis]|uniref:hypothetical protein n=1 Tax=Glutamicibacter ardleyensis TaxID=225894 RepID=UPI003FD12EF4
ISAGTLFPSFFESEKILANIQTPQLARSPSPGAHQVTVVLMDAATPKATKNNGIDGKDVISLHRRSFSMMSS